MKTKFKNLLAAVGKGIAAWFSLSDVVFLVGVGSVGYGVYQLSPPWAFIIVGSFFVLLIIFGRLVGGPGNEKPETRN